MLRPHNAPTIQVSSQTQYFFPDIFVNRYTILSVFFPDLNYIFSRISYFRSGFCRIGFLYVFYNIMNSFFNTAGIDQIFKAYRYKNL